MANLNFKLDLKLGNDGETTVTNYLISKGNTLLSTNNDNKYDVKMLKDNIITTYEIKTDVKVFPMYDTGNMFVEFHSRGKESGVLTSQADWFVTYFKYLNEIWFIKTKKLKKLIENNDFPIFENAGDIGSKTHGYLLKRKDIKKHFHVYKI